MAKVILDFVNSNTEIWRHKIFAHSQNWKRDARLVSNDSTWPTEHFFFSKIFPKTSPLTCTGTQSLSFRHYFAKYWRKERLWASVQVKGNILVKSLLKKKCSVGQMLSFDTNLAFLFQFWEWAKFYAFKSQCWKLQNRVKLLPHSLLALATKIFLFRKVFCIQKCMLPSCTLILL